ncbi:MAG TPA: hypothetical protein VEV44_06635 [Pseudoneobacillus sp.]|nr:hypothetical protein [Pseudoneobacillus sp.]
MGVSPFQSVEDTVNLINFMNNHFEQNIALRWGVIRKEDHQLVGTCGFNA